MTIELELHTLLDDGEPHCSCGTSFRGSPHHDYTDHAIEQLRWALQTVADAVDGGDHPWIPGAEFIANADLRKALGITVAT